MTTTTEERQTDQDWYHQENECQVCLAAWAKLLPSKEPIPQELGHKGRSWRGR